MRANFADGADGGAVGGHDELVSAWGAGVGEALRLGNAKYLHAFFGDGLLVFHHFLHVQAHLDVFVDVGAACLGFLELGHHLLAIPFGYGGDLDAHVGLVDGADVGQVGAELCDDVADVLSKVVGSGFGFPTAFANQPDRGGKMHQCHDGLDAVFEAAGDDVAVVLDLVFVEVALFGFNSGPLDGKAVGVQSSVSK